MLGQEVETLEAQVRIDSACLAAAAAVTTSRKARRATEAKERGRGFLCQCGAPSGAQLSKIALLGLQCCLEKGLRLPTLVPTNVPTIVPTTAASWV